MISIDQIIRRAKKYLPDVNQKRIREAFEFAQNQHKDQKRTSGEKYIFHPLAVAGILLDFSPDEDTIIASLLHDITEDCDITIDDIKKKFGLNVAMLVDGMEKLSHIQAKGLERQVGSLRKMFLAMAKDIRVVLIKLADRLHNMQTLHFLREDKQKRIAKETLLIYAPIAARLGIYALKGPLEDLSFFYLFPEEYAEIAEQMKQHESYRTRILKNAKSSLQKSLKKDGIEGIITGRVKHFYSIWKKLQKKDKESIDNLYDIFALRIIVDNLSDCYSVLGRIHQNWTPLSRRFKDYIAVPKPNGYRSLHTTVIGLSGIKDKSVPIEIQIRTQKMQEEAEFGVAAHWAYKEVSLGISENKSEWIKSLIDIGKKTTNNKDFMNSLETDIFSDRIFVLTPNGDVHDLPKEATPIDFAFSIHTSIGLSSKAAKVNGKIVPLHHHLNNGDVIEIITTKNYQPHQNWISFVKTSQARNNIRKFFKSQNKEKIIREGRNILNKHLERFNLDKLNTNLQILKNISGKRKTLKEREEILERIGNGSLSPSNIIKGILKERIDKEGEKFSKIKINSNDEDQDKETENKKEEILIAGEDKIPIRIAECCHPKSQQPIVGFVTRGTHITIHSQNCRTLQNLDSKRLVEAKWANQEFDYVTFLIITNIDRLGLFRDIADVFAQRNIGLESGYSKRTSPITSEICLKARINNFDLANSVLDELEGLEGVKQVKQIF